MAMATFAKLLICLTIACISQSTAHFLLNYPPTIGFNDDLETTPPCGSFTVDFSSDNVTDFYVGGNSLAMTSIHPQATWLFRATLDTTASGNWTNLLPAVLQTGLGDYCESSVTVPASWAGSKGVIGVVQDAPDGILYQCAAVNFVTGTGTPPSNCKNVTGLSASFTTDAALSSLPATSTASSSTASTGTSTSGSTAKSSTTKSSSSKTVYLHTGLGSLAWAVIMGFATFMACLL